MSDQAILVQMLGDIQSRLGRIEATQSDIQAEVGSVSTRVAVVESHCKDSCVTPKFATTSQNFLGLSPTTWLRYAAAVVFAAYMLGTSSSQAKKTDVVLSSLKRAKIQLDSIAPEGE